MSSNIEPGFIVIRWVVLEKIRMSALVGLLIKLLKISTRNSWRAVILFMKKEQDLSGRGADQSFMFFICFPMFSDVSIYCVMVISE